MPLLIWCDSPVHISTSGHSPQYYTGTTWAGHLTPQQNHIVSEEYNTTIRILPTQYLLFLSRPVLSTDRRCSYGFPVSPIVVNLYMEHFERTALSTAATPGFGLDLLMTHLSSNRKNTNSTSWNISTMCTQPSSLLWKTTNWMGLYHS